VKKAERLVDQGDATGGALEVARATSALDRAAHKGVIHPNNAARRKSRLARKLNGL
jgi:small subunit ribosomal protein S20